MMVSIVRRAQHLLAPTNVSFFTSQLLVATAVVGDSSSRFSTAVAATSAAAVVTPATPNVGSGATAAPAAGQYPRIDVVIRTKLGSRNSQWARVNGYIPGIVYGGPEGSGNGGSSKGVVYTYSPEVDLRREIATRRTSFLNTLYEIEIDGKIERVLPRDVQLHPFRPKIISVNWLRYIPGRYPGVKLDLPLKATNEERCPALREGGWLLEVMHKIPVFVHGPQVPEYLAMDLRGKRTGEKVMASELDLQPGVTLRALQRDFAVAKLLGSKAKGAEEEVATDEKAKPAATPKAKADAKPDAKPAK